MKSLLDTNVVSDAMRRRPDEVVARWMAEQDHSEVFLSVITILEIRKGLEIHPSVERRRALDAWLTNDLLVEFEWRLLPVSLAVAQVGGGLIAAGIRTGRTVAPLDGLIAATAIVHGLTVVTGNTRDFQGLGVEVVNPWLEGASGHRDVT